MIDNKTILVTGGTGSFGNTIVKNILSDYKPKEIVIYSRDEKKQDDMRKKYNNPKIKFHIGDVRDPNYQNRLIVDYLERTFALEDDVIKTVKKINKDLNSNIPQVEVFRNLTWKPMKFQFSNMFSYGKGNSVDFSNMRGAYGLFAHALATARADLGLFIPIATCL